MKRKLAIAYLILVTLTVIGMLVYACVKVPPLAVGLAVVVVTLLAVRLALWAVDQL